jgi:hypothetical protein
VPPLDVKRAQPLKLHAAKMRRDQLDQIVVVLARPGAGIPDRDALAREVPAGDGGPVDVLPLVGRNDKLG